MSLDCAPALPKFCANIHVGCAGRSRIETWPFRLVFNDTSVLHREGFDPVHLDVTFGEQDAVFRLPGSRDWIRILLSDGKDRMIFSQRICRNGQALMTRGTCRPE